MIDIPLRIVRSVVDAGALARALPSEYPLGSLTRCRLVSVGMNDHYLAVLGGVKYVLRVYKRDNFWVAGESACRFELEWLAFLRGRSLPVSHPVARGNGDLLGSLEAPEGARYYALFTFAEGRIQYPPDLGQSRQLGRKIALIHLASREFRSAHCRVHFDLDFILREPTRRILGSLGGQRGADRAFLTVLAERLAGRVGSLPATEETYGVIGGDFSGANNHFDDGNKVTFFDFDLCGYGWRAYDLSKFLWSVRQLRAPLALWEAFLAGYESVCRLRAEEVGAMGPLAVIRQVFHMAHYVKLADCAGVSLLSAAFWAANFDDLRAFAALDSVGEEE